MPLPVIPNVPALFTTSETELGGLPTPFVTLVTFTKKVKLVAVVPVVGDTPRGLETVTVWLPFVQLAARVTAGDPRDASRSATIRSHRPLMSPPPTSRTKCLAGAGYGSHRGVSISR